MSLDEVVGSRDSCRHSIAESTSEVKIAFIIARKEIM